MLVFKITRPFSYFIKDSIAALSTFGKNIVKTIEDHYYDKKIGIETCGDCGMNEKEERSQYRDEKIYAPTPYFTIRKMIDYLKLSEDDVFIDLGCGKGRVVFFVAIQKLKKVIGIELKETVLNIAKKNLSTLKLNNTDIELVHGDAATFDVKEGTVFFLFDPFGYKTLIKFLDNVKESLISNPRKIRLIYYYGKEFKVLLDISDWLVSEGEIDKTGIFVWSNKDLQYYQSS